MTSCPTYWCPKIVKWRPCWCPKPILWELNLFLMQIFSFVQWISKAAGHVISHVISHVSNNVFERRTSTGSGLFSFFDGGFAQIFSQIASITVKKLRNTNFISSRHVKRENTSLPVDVRRSKTSLLKLPISKKFSTQRLYFSNFFNLVKNVTIQFWITKLVAFNAKNSKHCSLLLAYSKCPLHPQTRCSRFTLIALDLTILSYTKLQ